MSAGDHIRIRKSGAWEHAIDVGDRTVIHFEKGSGVKRSHVSDLANGGPVEVVIHPTRVYAPRLVVARAFSRFSESAYAAMFPDSEAFALWCKTGQIPAAPLAVSPAPAAAAAPKPVATVTSIARARKGAAVKAKGKAAKPKAKARVKAKAAVKAKPAATKAKPAHKAKARAKAKPARKAAVRAGPAKKAKPAATKAVRPAAKARAAPQKRAAGRRR
jgi:histone H1/5